MSPDAEIQLLEAKNQGLIKRIKQQDAWIAEAWDLLWRLDLGLDYYGDMAITDSDCDPAELIKRRNALLLESENEC